MVDRREILVLILREEKEPRAGIFHPLNIYSYVIENKIQQIHAEEYGKEDVHLIELIFIKERLIRHGISLLLLFVEIDPLCFYYERSVHDTVIDVKDIFAEKSDEEKLDRTQYEHTDNYGSHTCGELIPPDKL